MNNEAWGRFMAGRHRITGELLAGVVIGVGIGLIAAAAASSTYDPSRMATLGFVALFFGICGKFSCSTATFGEANFGRPR